MYDVVIIGAGVSGSACARELSKYNLSICVVEKEEDVCCGTSKANSAIVHSGIDCKTGTLMAQMNIRGNEMMDELSKQLDFEFRRNGSLILCFSEDGPYQFQNQSLPNNFIDQQPVRLDVTFSHVLIISGISESMISIRLRQRLLVTQQRDHFLQLLRIAASLDRKLVISFELPRKLRLKHSAPPSDLQRYQTDHTYPLPFLPPPSPHR